jgi:hypothetical protein
VRWVDPSWSRRWSADASASASAGAWVAAKLGHTESSVLAAALAQSLHACAATTGEPVDITVAVADQRIRITARTPQPVPPQALKNWRQHADRLSIRHEHPVPTVLWAELDQPENTTTEAQP